MTRRRNTKPARDLIKGDVVASGEVVTKKAIERLITVGRKVCVHLHNPKTGKDRLAFWGFHSSIFMK